MEGRRPVGGLWWTPGQSSQPSVRAGERHMSELGTCVGGGIVEVTDA